MFATVHLGPAAGAQGAADRHRANKPIGESVPVFEALGGLSPQTPEQLWAIAFTVYGFNAHGIDHNQRYVSDAIMRDGTPNPGFIRDPELYHQSSSRPGAELPHAWITSGTRRLSALDTLGKAVSPR
ncbi:hypothetical protein AV521_37710 [Streptomyces sp. IMTB 2501]|nr:hypothetical protein AV521_37710 [Streptomyces sp. IMTB 2501]